MSETPLVNVHTLRRDIYILSALLLADKAIADITPLAELSTNHYESELNRLLIMMATAARQLLDNNAAEDISEIAARECGAKIIGDNRNALPKLSECPRCL